MSDALTIATQRFERMHARAVLYWQSQARDALEARTTEEWRLLRKPDGCRYDTFGDYLEAACGWGSSQVYAGMGALERLAELPAETIERLPLGNAVLLGQIPAQERDPATVTAAVEQTAKEFERVVRRTKAHLHIDHSIPFAVRLHETAEAVVRDAIAKAKSDYNLTADGAALEQICVEWIMGEVSAEQRRAAEALYREIEDSITLDEVLGRPPGMESWGRILAAAKAVSKLFGIKERVLTVEIPETGEIVRIN